MESKVQIKEALEQKMEAEYLHFLEELEKKASKEIIESAYEKVFKEDIVLAVSESNLSLMQLKALNDMDAPLDSCYGAWLKQDVSYMEDLFFCVEQYASSMAKEQKIVEAPERRNEKMANKNEQITFEIVERIAVLAERETGWKKEINMVAWMWFSRGFGGYTALDYLIKVKGISFVEAVRTLNRQEPVRSHSVSVCSSSKGKKKRLLLPPKSESSNKVMRYLHMRGIDREIIRYCIERQLLYQSEPYGNAVFIGYDRRGEARYASFRSTNGTRILGDAAGSDKRYGFHILNFESDKLHSFESAIDLLSYATLVKLQGGDWKKENLLSLAGVYRPKLDGNSKVPLALSTVLSENEKIKELSVHFDNDHAGRKSTKGIQKSIGDRLKVVDEPPPYGKDYNDYLCMQIRTPCSKRERSMRENGIHSKVTKEI